VVSMFVFDHQSYVETFFKSESECIVVETTTKEEEHEPAKSKKKKGKKPAQTEESKEEARRQDLAKKKVAHLKSYVENLGLKVFEEKQEKNEDGQWAKTLFEPHVHSALPATVNRKIFETLDYKKA